MVWAGLLVGVLIGIVSGLVGIGGGVLLIPILVYGFKLDQHTAQGTSLAALLAPIGLLAFWEYYKAGHVELRLGLLVALGFFIGGYFGGLWAQQLSESVLRKAFAVLLAIVAAKMFLQK